MLIFPLVMPHKNTIVVFMTTKNAFEAKKIAGVLVKSKLAACINIVEKISSIYSWQGKIVKGIEALCIIKTTKKRFKSLKNKIESLHSYTVPEIIGLPIEVGSKKYLNWLVKETK